MSDSKPQPGLMKKLLFPAYADAGSNENFHASSQEDVVSESDATTAVLDNRTACKPQQHEVQYDGDQIGGYAPSADGSCPLDDSLLTHTGTEAETQEKTRFFPMTDPPQSPSLPPAQSLGQRSTSTTTRSGIRPFPTTSPRVPEVDHSLDHSSVTATSSAAVSSVLGVNFLNESKAEDEPTPVKDNRSINLGDYSNVFQPRMADLGDDKASEIMSDINSTASEMGTVVGASGRLAEVQAMAAFMEQSMDPLYEADSAADEPFSPAKDVPGLALPTLDERRTEQRSLPTKSRDTRNSVFREKVDSVFRDRGAPTTTPPPPEESPSPTSAKVSAAIRRLGSGVGNHNTNKSPSNVHGPYSAPTTPRVGVPPSP